MLNYESNMPYKWVKKHKSHNDLNRCRKGFKTGNIRNISLYNKGVAKLGQIKQKLIEFEWKSGTRQDVHSMLLCNIVLEILARAIREAKKEGGYQ